MDLVAEIRLLEHLGSEPLADGLLGRARKDGFGVFDEGEVTVVTIDKQVKTLQAYALSRGETEDEEFVAIIQNRDGTYSYYECEITDRDDLPRIPLV